MTDDRSNMEIVGNRLMNGEITIQEFQTEKGSFQAIRFPELYEETVSTYKEKGWDFDETKLHMGDCDLVILNNDKDFFGEVFPKDKPYQDVADEAELLEKFLNGRAEIKWKQSNHSFGWSYPVIVVKTPLTEMDFDWFDSLATKHEDEVKNQ